MKFCSTRGVRGVSFKNAIIQGYAQDGGLFLPEVIPQLSSEKLEEWRAQKKGYLDICKEVLALFVTEDEIPRSELDNIVERSFEDFNKRGGEPVPMVNVGLENSWFMEMFHGPTGAFKDLALSILGNFLDYFLGQDKKHSTIVVGDTGSSAICAVKKSKWMDIVVLFPNGRISNIQELQMVTHPEPNVHVYACDGTSDDLDVPIKAVLTDKEFASNNNLGSINSINLARIIIQAAHYIYGISEFQFLYSREGYITAPKSEDVIFFVPTGACGNITGGCLASKMGVPFKIVACVNENDIVHGCLETGIFQNLKPVTQTIAPSLDILVPYNWERIMYLLLEGDSQAVRAAMDEFEATGKMVMQENFMKATKDFLVSKTVHQQEVKEAIRHYHKIFGYLLDPHSAVGAHVVHSYSQNPEFASSSLILLCTASPEKFRETVEAIVGLNLNLVLYNKLELLDRFVKPMSKKENWEELLRSKIVEITNKATQ